MSNDKNTERTEAESQETEQFFDVTRVYVKDISVETPNTPEIFTMDWEPEINLELGNESTVLDKENGIMEVALTVTVTATVGEKTAYVIEVVQAGIFTVKGFEPEQSAYFVGAMIPNTLFPYARENVSSLVQKAGFPSMLLTPIDFNGLYQQHLMSQLEDMEKAGKDG